MEIWGALISCSGSIITTLITAFAAIKVAQITKEEKKKRYVQATLITLDEKSEIKEILPTDKQVNPSKISLTEEKKIENNLMSKQRALSLGIISILIVLMTSCTILGLSAVQLEPSQLLCFSGVALVFGIIAIVSRKKWAVNTALILSGLLFIIQLLIGLFWAFTLFGYQLGKAA